MNRDMSRRGVKRFAQHDLKKHREGFARIWNLVGGPITEGERAIETATARIMIEQISLGARSWKS